MLLSSVTQVHDEAAARVRVVFGTGGDEGYQYKTHPSLDKTLFARNILGLRDAERPFISGDILKWRMQARAPPLLHISNMNPCTWM